jgi:hypothetical protein
MRRRRVIWALLRPAAKREKTSRSRSVRWTLPKRDSVAPRDARSAFPAASGAPASRTTFPPRATDRIVLRKSLAEIPFSTNPDTPASVNSALPERECAGCLPRCAEFRCRRGISFFANVLLSAVSKWTATVSDVAMKYCDSRYEGIRREEIDREDEKRGSSLDGDYSLGFEPRSLCAYVAISNLVWRASFSRMLCTWLFTVWTAMFRCWAISLLLSPAAI